MTDIAAREATLGKSIGEHYAMLERNESIRPTLGNDMQILYMRDRQTFTFLLHPELMETAYNVGKEIGKKYIAPYLTGKTLQEILETNLPIASRHKYAIQELVYVGENRAAYRSYECADCYGLPDIGMKICVYEAGTAAGAFSAVLNRPVEVKETKCCANGDPYCEFEITVLEQTEVKHDG